MPHDQRGDAARGRRHLHLITDQLAAEDTGGGAQPVCIETLHEARVRLGVAGDVLDRLEAARHGYGPYVRVPRWLLAEVPRTALAIATPAVTALARELASEGVSHD